MRRWLALVLLCLLPLQASWAVVANYCLHEKNAAVSHFGHHTEEHQGAADHDDHDDDSDAGEPGHGHHHDHLSGFLGLTGSGTGVALPAEPSVVEGDDRIYPSLPPEQPERPNWVKPA